MINCRCLDVQCVCMIWMLACCWCMGKSTRKTFSLSLSCSHTQLSDILSLADWFFLFPFIPFSLIHSCLQSPPLSTLLPFYCLLLLVLSSVVPRGPVEPPGGHGEMERSGGPHSDSGSISPTWERDRRGPPTGPPGHLGPPGACVYVCVYVQEKQRERHAVNQ